MEIRKYQDIIGVVTTEDIKEGRMVLLTAHSQSHDFGSREDIPGVKKPDDTTEAALAKYVIAFAVSLDPAPIYNPYPAFDYALRGGFDQAANVPFNAQVYLTHPGNMRGQTIPSGSLALAFGGGVYTVWSGEFSYSANIVPGARLGVMDTASDSEADAGKLEYVASGGIATVIQYNSSTGDLTFRTDNP